MLQSISWKQYILFLLIATIIYYLFIWVVFFKAKLALLPRLSGTHRISLKSGDQPDEVMTTAQHVMDELRPLFENRASKSELLLALQIKLKKYSQWEEPVFRDTINEFILNESQTKCSIRLGEDDKRALWLQA